MNPTAKTKTIVKLNSEFSIKFEWTKVSFKYISDALEIGIISASWIGMKYKFPITKFFDQIGLEIFWTEIPKNSRLILSQRTTLLKSNWIFSLEKSGIQQKYHIKKNVHLQVIYKHLFELEINDNFVFH